MERDRLSKGTWCSKRQAGVLPIVSLDGKLDQAVDALADALSVVLQIRPNVYLEKRGFLVHADVELDKSDHCIICKRQMNKLRVLCATCRRAPPEARFSHSYVQLCWQGSHPRLFTKEVWELCAEARSVERDAIDQIQICIQTDGEAVRVQGENFLVDDLRRLPHWKDAHYLQGHAAILAAEIYPMALGWVQRVDARRFGHKRSKELAANLEHLAARMAAHSAWHKEWFHTFAEKETFEAIEKGAWVCDANRAERVKLLEDALKVLEEGEYGLVAKLAEVLPPEDPLARMAAAGDLRAVHQWRNSFGPGKVREIKKEVDFLKKKYGFPRGALVSDEPDLPELEWVSASRQLRVNVEDPPAYYPEDDFRHCRMLAIVTQMLKIGDLPIGTVRKHVIQSSLRKTIVSAHSASDACRAATAHGDLAFAFLRAQSMVERPNPIVEDEMIEAVTCLRHFSLAEIGTLVSVGLDFDMEGKQVVDVIKDRVVARLPAIWEQRGYREWLQHCLPALLVHTNQLRSSRAACQNPVVVWKETAVLWHLPKVRDFDYQTLAELQLFREDVFGRAGKLIETLLQERRFFYKRRVGKRMAVCCAGDDLRRLLG